MVRPGLPPAEAMKLFPLAPIARGGMGSVELARAEDGRFAGRLFAIKRLHDNIAKDPNFVAMFLDETWMTAALASPNVVRVAAWGNDDQGMFLAVELVQGVSLMRLLKEARQSQEIFAERTVAYIGSQICAGLAAAHGLRGPDGALLGLVHRDLTASNVLVSFDGEVKIVDFGIAKAEQRITHTQTGELKGKPGYMAPEQSRGGKVDARSDIFSFGVLMFELLAGRRPWIGSAAFEVMLAAASEPPPDLAELRKGCNPLFVQIVNKCLEKKPEDRFSSAAEVQALLDTWRREKGFGPDDQASLSAFTRRNCARQMEWFERAIRGEFAKQEVPTFQELQEQLDESRDKKPSRSGLRSAPAPAPAAGRDALAQMSANTPQAPAASSGHRPMPEPGENDPTRVQQPGSARGPKLAGAAAGGAAPRITPPSPGPLPMTRRGTELMPERDPLASPASRPGGGGPVSAPMSSPVPNSARRGTELMPEMSSAAASPLPPRAHAQPAMPAPPVTPEALPLPPPASRPVSEKPAAPPSGPSSADAPAARSASERPASQAAPASPAPPPRPKQQKRSQAPTIALLILLPVFVGFILWQFRARILEVSGRAPQAAQSAPAAQATPTTQATPAAPEATQSAPAAQSAAAAVSAVDPAAPSAQPGPTPQPDAGSDASAPGK